MQALVRDGVLIEGASPTTELPWWSFTKTALAAACLALVRDGFLALDAPLPARGCTLRQLLQHRAGLADYGPLAAYQDAVARDEDAWPPKLVVERARADRLVHAPGSGWLYSNIGYYFIRRLIEDTTGESLGPALSRLVLEPLGITGARFAATRADLAGVMLGHRKSYDPRWVYHGLLVGPIGDAALLLHRLVSSDFLPAELVMAMLDRHPVQGTFPGRPWTAPGYGLGVMSGTATGGRVVAGHTGGGPGSVTAIYHALDLTDRRTAAAWMPGDEQGVVESACFALLYGGKNAA